MKLPVPCAIGNVGQVYKTGTELALYDIRVGFLSCAQGEDEILLMVIVGKNPAIL